MSSTYGIDGVYSCGMKRWLMLNCPADEVVECVQMYLNEKIDGKPKFKEIRIYIERRY